HVDQAVVEAAGPEVAAVVGEAAVMRLVTSTDGDRGDHLAVRLPVLRVGADRDELVLPVADAVGTERPDVDPVLLPGDLRHVGRHARLVGAGGGGEREECDEHDSGSTTIRHRTPYRVESSR